MQPLRGSIPGCCGRGSDATPSALRPEHRRPEGLRVKDEPGPWRRRLRQVVRNKMLLLMLGGAVGTYARYGLSRWVSGYPWAQGFPFATLFINVSGSFVLAFAAVVILERLPPEHQDWFLLIGTGFCGGYTTFSTFEWETFKLV